MATDTIKIITLNECANLAEQLNVDCIDLQEVLKSVGVFIEYTTCKFRTLDRVLERRERSRFNRT